MNIVVLAYRLWLPWLEALDEFTMAIFGAFVIVVALKVRPRAGAILLNVVYVLDLLVRAVITLPPRLLPVVLRDVTEEAIIFAIWVFGTPKLVIAIFTSRILLIQSALH